jgi:hypothetical protein
MTFSLARFTVYVSHWPMGLPMAGCDKMMQI